MPLLIILLFNITAYFSIINLVVEISGFFLSCLKHICKADKFLKMIEEEDGNVDIENLLGKVTDNLIVSGVKEYSGMSIGNGKIAIGIPGTDKSIVLEANDIETFKQSLVK